MSSSSDRFEDLDAVAVAQWTQRVLRARYHLAADRHRDAAAGEPEQRDEVGHARADGDARRLAVHRDRERCQGGFRHRVDDTLRRARAERADEPRPGKVGGDALAASRGLGPAVAAIDLEALRANYAAAQRLAAGRRVIAVVKADAYGHGAASVARALASAGCGALATWSVGEAVALRDAGIASPLLVLAGVRDAAEADEVVARSFTAVLHDAEGRASLAAAARRRGARASVHVEVDTGMRRMGVPLSGAEAFIAEVVGDPALALDGVMTHFARADEPDLAPTREQLREFAALIAALRQRGIAHGSVHTANSAGLVALAVLAADGPAQDAVRPGLLLYGAQPCTEQRVPLRPVMSLRAPVVALRTVRRGDAVGYAALYRARGDTRIATLALGYADGVPIAASGRGSVWLAGARRPIAGRVSMDYVGVEVGDAPVRLGDQAVVFGSETEGGPAVLPVEEAAQCAGTISYELFVRVGARVRREHRDSV
jgi:alanine racemase